MVEQAPKERTPKEKLLLMRSVAGLTLDNYNRGRCGVYDLSKALQGVVKAGVEYPESDAEREYVGISARLNKALATARIRNALDVGQLRALFDDNLLKINYLKGLKRNGIEPTMGDIEKGYTFRPDEINPFL